ncbi:MAG: hypothetical protein KY468_04625 [Armatimonadetes bacterium]|nr:hypothetical protein [Armatimonadota bacterium]
MSKVDRFLCGLMFCCSLVFLYLFVQVAGDVWGLLRGESLVRVEGEVEHNDSTFFSQGLELKGHPPGNYTFLFPKESYVMPGEYVELRLLPRSGYVIDLKREEPMTP